MMDDVVSVNKFEEFVRNFIIPLFSGTDIVSKNDPIPKRNIRNLVTQCPNKGPDCQKIMPSANAKYCLTIQRPQPFTKDEISFLQLFLKKAEEKNVYQDMGEAFFNDSINSLMTLVISEKLELGDISYHIIYNFLNWSQQTYEGQNIAMCIGVRKENPQEPDTRNTTHQINLFQDIIKEDFLKVLSNGFDTMIVLNQSGNFYDLITLSENTDENAFVPIRFSRVAKWTSINDNVAFVLNRNGEILIFKKGEIIFSRRNGKWFFYSHMQAIKQISIGTGRSIAKEIREAIYLTSLDVAFSRTGGCIGYVRKMHKGGFDNSNILAQENNFAHKKEDVKKSVLLSIVGKKKFHELPRLLRMELAAVDGATIISYNGELVSVGAILHLADKDIYSTGGGRALAAIHLALYGLGVKISNDGYINFYANTKQKQKNHPILQIN